MEESNGPKRCGFFVKRKRRYCKMLPAKGNTHCAEHLCFQTDQKGLENKRVNCPLDPSHTVFKQRLEKHLKKCNSNNKNQEKFYAKNINSGIGDYEFSEKELMSLNAVPKAEIDDLIRRVKECYMTNEIKPEKFMGTHKILAKELENEEYGQSNRKHLIQQDYMSPSYRSYYLNFLLLFESCLNWSPGLDFMRGTETLVVSLGVSTETQASLINILESSKAFRTNTAFIEFGAGKGKLSHWLQKAVGEVENVEFLLVDRQNHRNKFDCYHKSEDQGPTFKRLYVDIEHLNLSKVDGLTGKSIVAVGKHLCGAATDLSLRCLIETDLDSTNSVPNPVEKRQKLDAPESNVELILFALCCFHRCSWPTYAGKEFFTNNGFTAIDFHRMKQMSSWATCGFRYHEKGKSNFDENLIEKQGDKPSIIHSEDDKTLDEPAHETAGSSDSFKLTSEEKKIIGLQCKRLIDIGRMKYLEQYGYSTQLMYYVDSDVTLEDVVLLAKKR